MVGRVLASAAPHVPKPEAVLSAPWSGCVTALPHFLCFLCGRAPHPECACVNFLCLPVGLVPKCGAQICLWEFLGFPARALFCQLCSWVCWRGAWPPILVQRFVCACRLLPGSFFSPGNSQVCAGVLGRRFTLSYLLHPSNTSMRLLAAPLQETGDCPSTESLPAATAQLGVRNSAGAAGAQRSRCAKPLLQPAFGVVPPPKFARFLATLWGGESKKHLQRREQHLHRAGGSGPPLWGRGVGISRNWRRASIPQICLTPAQLRR